MDGGVRSGQDVIRALALGAKGVLYRPRLPVRPRRDGRGRRHRCLDIIRKELDLTMAFCGLRDIKQVTADILARPKSNYPPLSEHELLGFRER